MGYADQYTDPLAIRKTKHAAATQAEIRDPVEVGEGGNLTPPPSFGAGLPTLGQTMANNPQTAAPPPSPSPAPAPTGAVAPAAAPPPTGPPLLGPPAPTPSLPARGPSPTFNPQGLQAPTLPAPQSAPTLGPTPQTSLRHTGPSAAAGLQQPVAPNAMQAAAQEALTALLGRAQQPVSINDPQLQPQADAFRVSQQRNAERMRGSAAERLAQQGFTSGGSGGALDSTINQIDAQRGLNEANFNANLVGDEMKARRAELIDGIQLAASMGDTEAARALQRELATVDTGLRERGLTLQEGLGGSDISLRTRALALDELLGTGGLGLQNRGMTLQETLGLGGLGLAQRGQALDEYVGQSEQGRADRSLDLQELLGLGNLGLQSRDQDLREYLGQAGVGHQGRALDLQERLGTGDLDLRRDTLGVNRELGQGDLGLRLMQALLQDNQFFSGLGLDAALGQAGLNQAAVNALLNLSR